MTTDQERHKHLLSAALDYAKHGLRIAPGHEPLFDNHGNLTGCSCEANKRSANYERWLKNMHAQGKCKNKQYDPNFKCRTPGKHPRLSDWETKASNDPKQIIEWWTKWPTANICLPPGINGLVTFDLDSYKEVYGDDNGIFTQADKDTVTQISGGGGEHLVYQMPPGKAYTNANNSLPPGIDIRGVGGQILVEPSLHPSGNQYQWEDGFSILEYAPRPLPASLQTILDAAHEKVVKAHAVTFTTPTTERPELIRWKLSKAVRELINNPPPVGQRSEADMKVITALCYAGATNDEILAVFEHYPIGTQGKFAEAGSVYLAHTIGKARGYVEMHPRPDVGATVENLRLWVRTHNFADYRSELLTKRIDRKTGKETLVYLTDSTDTRTADAILDIMSEAQRLTVNVGKKRLAKLAGLGSCNTALKALARLYGWLFDVTIDPVHGTQVSLCDSSRLHRIDPLLGNAIVYKRDQSCANDYSKPEINEYSPHKADEPFLIGTSKLMRERIQDIALATDITPDQAKEDYTFASFGESGLRVLDAMIRAGDMTAQELADETGKKVSSIRAAVRKLAQHGIVEAEREGAHGPKVYSLAADVWQRIDELAPSLRTYTTAARRENKRLEAAQQWAQKGIAEAQQGQNTEQAQRLERRFAKLAHERLPHLERLHPDLAPKDIERLAYEVAAYKRSPEVAQQLRTVRSAAQDEHRDEIRLIRELADSIMDVGATLDEAYTEIMKFGTFSADLVQQVLRSPVQMKNYESVAGIRQRMEKAERMAVFA